MLVRKRESNFPLFTLTRLRGDGPSSGRDLRALEWYRLVPKDVANETPQVAPRKKHDACTPARPWNIQWAIRNGFVFVNAGSDDMKGPGVRTEVCIREHVWNERSDSILVPAVSPEEGSASEFQVETPRPALEV